MLVAMQHMQVGGTWAWAAPEVLLGKQSTTQADIYSFGVVIWELVTGEQPIRGNAREVSVPAECPSVSDPSQTTSMLSLILSSLPSPSAYFPSPSRFQKQ